jgi:hypothetical protein
VVEILMIYKELHIVLKWLFRSKFNFEKTMFELFKLRIIKSVRLCHLILL